MCEIHINSTHRFIKTYLRHVHVINEDEQTPPRWRTVCILCPLLHIGLQIPLYIQGRCSTGEIHVQQHL